MFPLGKTVRVTSGTWEGRTGPVAESDESVSRVALTMRRKDGTVIGKVQMKFDNTILEQVEQ